MYCTCYCRRKSKIKSELEWTRSGSGGVSTYYHLLILPYNLFAITSTQQRHSSVCLFICLFVSSAIQYFFIHSIFLHSFNIFSFIQYFFIHSIFLHSFNISSFIQYFFIHSIFLHSFNISSFIQYFSLPLFEPFYSFLHSSFIHSFTQSLIHSFIHSVIHSFIQYFFFHSKFLNSCIQISPFSHSIFTHSFGLYYLIYFLRYYCVKQLNHSFIYPTVH